MLCAMNYRMPEIARSFCCLLNWIAMANYYFHTHVLHNIFRAMRDFCRLIVKVWATLICVYVCARGCMCWFLPFANVQIECWCAQLKFEYKIDLCVLIEPFIDIQLNLISIGVHASHSDMEMLVRGDNFTRTLYTHSLIIILKSIQRKSDAELCNLFRCEAKWAHIS